MYNSYLNDDKLYIVFHKSCVDGFFSVILFLKGISLLNDRNMSNFELFPLTPSDIIENKDKVKYLFNKKKVILDLAIFGNNITYYFDHHISNQHLTSKYDFKGKYNRTAASTCELLYSYFDFKKHIVYSSLVEIANVIDQAKFKTPPPIDTDIRLITNDELIWACNDLFKGVKGNSSLLKLFDSFSLDNLPLWILKNKKYITEYRIKRKITINFIERIEYNPIIIIINNKYHLQAESLHFTYSATKNNYLMLVLADKLNKKSYKEQSGYRFNFRLNPNLNQDQTEKFRVDIIAQKIGGGGHKSAASAKTSNFNNAYSKTIDWINKFKIQYSEQIL